MIENSKKWAQARNLVHRSEVHGEEEWRVPLQREFEFKEQDRKTTSSSAGFVTQDWNTQTCPGHAVLYHFLAYLGINCLKDSTGEILCSPLDADAAMHMTLEYHMTIQNNPQMV